MPKCANSFGTNRLKPYFYPHQLGVGTPGRCEAAVHSTRRYLEALPPDHVVVKLDLSNAFNSIHRREMLLSVYDRIAELYAFCRSAYSQPSCLFFGPYIVSSEEGVQQGDPIGPLLFCNTIHPVLSSLESNLNLGYLDDVTLGGTVETVHQMWLKLLGQAQKSVCLSMCLSVNLLPIKTFRLTTACCSHSNG